MLFRSPRVTTGIFLLEQKARANEISSVLRANKTAAAGADGANGAWSLEYVAVISGSVISEVPRIFSRSAVKLIAQVYNEIVIP